MLNGLLQVREASLRLWPSSPLLSHHLVFSLLPWHHVCSRDTTPSHLPQGKTTFLFIFLHFFFDSGVN